MLWETCKSNHHTYCGSTDHAHTGVTRRRVGTNEETTPLCEDLGDAIETTKLHSVIDGVQYGSTINDFLAGRLCPRSNTDGDDNNYFNLDCIKGVCAKCEGLDTLEKAYTIDDT